MAERGSIPERMLRRVAMLALILLAAAAGCETEEKVTGVGYGEFGQTSSGSGSGSRSGSTASGGGGGLSKILGGGGGGESTDEQWAIALGRFKRSDHKQQAARSKRRLQSAVSFADLWIDDEGETSMLYHGRYNEPHSQAAQQDLRRWQQLRKSGRVKTPVLMLAPLIDSPSGKRAKYDLRNAPVHNPQGPDNKYSLQIGFYDDRFDQGDFRQAAEQAAAELRKQGYQAFFYHGPNRSMVTVGLFTADAVQPVGEGGKQQYSQQVRSLQQEFPHNGANGRKLMMGQRGTPKSEKKPQPSFLVRIPGADSVRSRSGTIRR